MGRLRFRLCHVISRGWLGKLRKAYQHKHQKQASKKKISSPGYGADICKDSSPNSPPSSPTYSYAKNPLDPSFSYSRSMGNSLSRSRSYHKPSLQDPEAQTPLIISKSQHMLGQHQRQFGLFLRCNPCCKQNNAVRQDCMVHVHPPAAKSKPSSRKSCSISGSDVWEREGLWSVVAQVNDQVIKKTVVLKKRRSGSQKKEASSIFFPSPAQVCKGNRAPVNSENSSSDYSQEEEEMKGQFGGFRLSTSSVDAGSLLDADAFAWDREHCSFTSEESIFHPKKPWTMPNNPEIMMMLPEMTISEGCNKESNYRRRGGSRKMGFGEVLESRIEEDEIGLEVRPRRVKKGRRINKQVLVEEEPKEKLLANKYRSGSWLGDHRQVEELEACAKAWDGHVQSFTNSSYEGISSTADSSLSSSWESGTPYYSSVSHHSSRASRIKESRSQDHTPKSHISLVKSDHSALPKSSRIAQRGLGEPICSLVSHKSQLGFPSKFQESIPVAKMSDNPYKDFRDSMIDMIIQKKISKSAELEELLQCYLSLNSFNFHPVIVQVFSDLWLQISQAN